MVPLELKGAHKGDDHDHLHLRRGGGRGFLGGTRWGRSDPITVGRSKALEGDPEAHRRGCPYGGGGGLTHARLRGSCAGFYRVNRKRHVEAKGRDHDATRGFVRSSVQLSPQS